MVKGAEKYRENIIYCLEYIIERNCDHNTTILNDCEIEQIDNEYSIKAGGKFTLFIGTNKYYIGAFTDKETALYILNNIDSISYVYSEFDDEDTVVGNIDYFIKNAFNNVYDKIYRYKAHVLYENYVEICEKPFTNEDISSFIRERIK